jgi:hypothetical protein
LKLQNNFGRRFLAHSPLGKIGDFSQGASCYDRTIANDNVLYRTPSNIAHHVLGADFWSTWLFQVQLSRQGRSLLIATG